MKTLLSLLLLSFVVIGSTTPPALQRYDFSDFGLVLEVPDTWESKETMKLTKKQSHRVMGRSYEHADSNSVHTAFINFLEIEVDSTLLPAPEAFDFHKLTIKIYGDLNWLDRWLWSQGKASLLKPFSVFPDKEHEYLSNHLEVLSDDDPRKIIKDAHAVAFEYKKDDVHVGSKGHIYWLVRGERCYRIQMEGISPKYEENRATYEAVLASMEFGE